MLTEKFAPSRIVAQFVEVTVLLPPTTGAFTVRVALELVAEPKAFVTVTENVPASFVVTMLSE